MSRLRVKWCCWRHRTLSKTSPKIHMERNVWFYFWKRNLGGGNSKIFLFFTPNLWGRWSYFDEHIFQLGWFPPPTGNSWISSESDVNPTDRCGLSIAQPGFWVVLSIIVVEGGPPRLPPVGWGSWGRVGWMANAWRMVGHGSVFGEISQL